MAYQVHDFQSKSKLYASQLNEMDAQIAANELESGRNVKTINGKSILGAGNLEISSMVDSAQLRDVVDEYLDEHLQNATRINLFDKTNVAKGVRVIPDGRLYNQSGYFTSDYILVNIGSTYVKNSGTGDTAKRYVLYDIDRKAIRAEQSNTLTVTEENAAYLRFSSTISELETTTLYEDGALTSVDAIARERLDVLEDRAWNPLTYDVHSGYHNEGASDYPSSAYAPYNHRMTSYIPMHGQHTLRVSLTYGQERAMWIAYKAIKMDGTYTKRIVLVDDAPRTSYSNVITFPDDYLAISFCWAPFSDGVFGLEGVTSSRVDIVASTFEPGYPLESVAGGYNPDGTLFNPTETLERRTPYMDAGNGVFHVSQHYDEVHDSWVQAAVQFANGRKIRYSVIPRTVKTTDYEATFVVPEEAVKVAFCWATYGEESSIKVSRLVAVDHRLDNVAQNVGYNFAEMFRKKPFIDHCFINQSTAGEALIPCQSAKNIQTCKRLGYDVIEGNVRKTSDGKYIVMHGEQGKFGQQVEHIDGVTDISGTYISSVTYDWIRQNVRQRSTDPRYSTPVMGLEEWLYECRYAGVIPLVECNDEATVQICDGILGKNNYIAYNASRAWTSGYITHFKGLTTLEDIISWCDGYGTPYIYCMSNPTAFTDAQLKEIVSELHKRGYLVSNAGTYLNQYQIRRCFRAGFDQCSADYNTNHIDHGNVVNLISDDNYTGFTTDGTISNGVITLTGNQSVTIASSLPVCNLAISQCEVEFEGNMNVMCGRVKAYQADTASDAPILRMSTFEVNAAPCFSITVRSGTVKIKSIVFKASSV